MKRFFKNNWVEIIAVIGVGLGIFLVVERIEIRQWLTTTTTTLAAHINSTLMNWLEYLARIRSQFTISDLLGYLLVIFGVVFIGWRARVRFLRSNYWQNMDCPRCRSTIHRIHRTRLDHFIGKLLLPDARRYRCDNVQCGWTGLKKVDRDSRQRHASINPFE